ERFGVPASRAPAATGKDQSRGTHLYTLANNFSGGDKNGNALGLEKAGNGSLTLNGANKFGGKTSVYWDTNAPEDSKKVVTDYFAAMGDASKKTAEHGRFKPTDLGRAAGDSDRQITKQINELDEKRIPD